MMQRHGSGFRYPGVIGLQELNQRFIGYRRNDTAQTDAGLRMAGLCFRKQNGHEDRYPEVPEFDGM